MALWGAGAAPASIPPPGNSLTPEDGPPADHQHGGTGGHLPAGSKNVKLISKLELTQLQDDGIEQIKNQLLAPMVQGQ